MGLVLLILFVILGFVKPKSTYVFILMSIFMLIVFGLNTFTLDRDIYEDRFLNYDEDYFLLNTEPIYTLFIRAFHHISLNYQAFIFAHGLIFVTSLAIFVYKSSSAKYKNIVLALYLMAVFSFNVDLMRSSLAMAISLWAFYALIDKHNVILFSLLTIFASTIHAMCVIYFIFLIPYYLKLETIKKLVLIVTPVTLVLMAIISQYLLQLSFVIGMGDKVENVYEEMESGSTNQMITFLLAVARLLPVILLYLFSFYFIKKKNVILPTEQIVVCKMNLFAICTIPLLLFSHDFFRLYFLFFLLNLCAISPFLRLKKVYWTACLGSLVVGYFFVWRPYFKHMFLDIFNNNILW